jgi:hypothetical protein
MFLSSMSTEPSLKGCSSLPRVQNDLLACVIMALLHATLHQLTAGQPWLDGAPPMWQQQLAAAAAYAPAAAALPLLATSRGRRLYAQHRWAAPFSQWMNGTFLNE